MTFDFNIPFNNVNGEKTDKTLADAFREFIGSSGGKKEDTIQGLHWYAEIQKEGKLDLDELSRKRLIEIIYNSEIIMLYVKDQYLKLLDPPKSE